MPSRNQKPIAKMFLLFLLAPLAAGGQTVGPLSQRRINESAASLLTAERAVLEAPRLRQPNEPLPDYCRRLVLTLPQETEAQRRTRINGYFAELEKATAQTATLRTVPPLCDSTPENRKRWRTISVSLSDLPRCLRRLHADLTREKSAPAALPTELTQTLYALHAAKEALRDARP